MKWKSLIIALFILLGALRAASQAGASYNFSIRHYIFNVHLSDLTNIIVGRATITVEFSRQSTSISFDLTGEKHDGRGMSVAGVTRNGRNVGYSHLKDVVTIQLEPAAEKGEVCDFEVAYAGEPDDGLIISENKYHHRTFFADNWPNRAHHWIPCVDDPSLKAPVDFFVSAPRKYDVISNGLLEETSPLDTVYKMSHWKELIPLPTKVMVIGVAEFAINHAGDVGCIPVSSWVFPENKIEGFYDYGQALEILPYFIEKIGAYPYLKLANVQSKTIFGGMENAGAIFYGENSITGARKTEGVLAHEIAHQWFGDFATETAFSHVWLSEGFATYMADLYFEHKYGTDTLVKILKQQRNEVISFAKKSSRPIVDSLTANLMDLLNPNSYQKGAWVLHMLRRKIGDALFWKSIRAYSAAYGGKNASTIDLEHVIETASHKDLGRFFQQWLFGSGYPNLAIAWKYNTKKRIATVNIRQLQDSVFEFPLELSFRSDDNNQLHSINIRERITTFDLPVKFYPGELVPDPYTSLLFTYSIDRIMR